jgi:hypothetical protein
MTHNPARLPKSKARKRGIQIKRTERRLLLLLLRLVIGIKREKNLLALTIVVIGVHGREHGGVGRLLATVVGIHNWRRGSEELERMLSGRCLPQRAVFQGGQAADLVALLVEILLGLNVAKI